jgi:hypothetical protein
MGARANRHRGEIEADFGGERRVMCLTLGALAELETAFAVDSLTGLAERFSSGRLKAEDLIRILGAGLRGGGNLFSDEDVAAMAISDGLAGFARIAADLLRATFGEGAPGPDQGPGQQAGQHSGYASGRAMPAPGGKAGPPENPPTPHPA